MRIDLLVPRKRADATSWWRYLLWLFLGNDHDGVYWPAVQPGGPVQLPGESRETPKFFWPWLRRNFGHNISFVWGLRPVIAPRYLWGNPSPLPPAHEVYKLTVLRFNPFFIKIGVFHWGWRSDTPIPGAWGVFGSGGGKLSWLPQFKRMT